MNLTEKMLKKSFEFEIKNELKFYNFELGVTELILKPGEIVVYNHNKKKLEYISSGKVFWISNFDSVSSDLIPLFDEKILIDEFLENQEKIKKTNFTLENVDTDYVIDKYVKKELQLFTVKLKYSNDLNKKFSKDLVNVFKTKNLNKLNDELIEKANEFLDKNIFNHKTGVNYYTIYATGNIVEFRMALSNLNKDDIANQIKIVLEKFKKIKNNSLHKTFL